MLRTAKLALLSLIISTSAYAAPERWFEVEVYIFKRDSATTEHWSETVPPVKLRGNVDLITPIVHTEHVIKPAVDCEPAFPVIGEDFTRSLMDDCVPQDAITEVTFPEVTPVNISADETPQVYQGDPATLLSYEQNQFTDIINKIRRQRGVTSLLHLTWQQAMLPKRRSKALHLYGGKDFSKEFQADGFAIKPSEPELLGSSDDVSPLSSDTINNLLQQNTPTIDSTAELASTPTEQATTKPATPIWELDGKLNIYLQHYLYIETDLRLRDPEMLLAKPKPESDEIASNLLADSSEADIEPQQPQEFLFSIPMIQNRRVRSTEIHYFDHPKMGMIIQIRKMPAPEEKPLEILNEDNAEQQLNQ
ncbi:peptidoglycan binding protein CsiV [Parashewanella tropica]|uniref:peptidoglycan binding protein CsiV n=1 Tax=Parashewanella tropica TaxID=2547970 RepID=UPI001059D69A|nr:peptidoglycan binding protein CsiV [Parashewanella tropica]